MRANRSDLFYARNMRWTSQALAWNYCSLRDSAARRLRTLLEDSALNRAAAFFDRIRDQRLSPACQAHCDPVRPAIDEPVVTLLDLPMEALGFADRLRRLWCEEPSVHGRNRKAVALLKDVSPPASVPN